MGPRNVERDLKALCARPEVAGDPSLVARFLGRALEVSMPGKFLTIHIERDGDLCCAYSTDGRLTETIAPGDWAHKFLRDGPQRIWIRGNQPVASREDPWPWEHWIDVAIGIRMGSVPVGLLMVSTERHGAIPSASEVSLAMALADAASGPLRAAELTRRLGIASARSAQADRAIGMVHDAAKQLAWLRSTSKRLRSKSVEFAAAQKSLLALEEVAIDLTKQFRRFLEDVGATVGEGVPKVPFGELVKDVAARVERIRAGGRIVCCWATPISGLPVPSRLEAVLENLLDNAVLASRVGEFVQISAARQATCLAVEIADRGDGMSREVALQAFDLGFTTRTGSGGTGVGLFVARSIMETLGGTVQLATRVDAGTRIAITIPLDLEADERREL